MNQTAMILNLYTQLNAITPNIPTQSAEHTKFLVCILMSTHIWLSYTTHHCKINSFTVPHQPHRALSSMLGTPFSLLCTDSLSFKLSPNHNYCSCASNTTIQKLPLSKRKQFASYLIMVIWTSAPLFNPFSHCLFCVSCLTAICHMRHPLKADLGKNLRRFWSPCVCPSTRTSPGKYFKTEWRRRIFTFFAITSPVGLQF